MAGSGSLPATAAAAPSASAPSGSGAAAPPPLRSANSDRRPPRRLPRLRHRPAVAVHEQQLDPRQRAPHRARGRDPVDRCARHDRPGLRQAVALDDAVPGRLLEGRRPRSRQRHPAARAQPQAGQRGAQAVGRELEQCAIGRRHAGESAHPVPGDRVGELLGVGPPGTGQHGRRTGPADLEQAGGQPVRVEQRLGEENAVHRGDGSRAQGRRLRAVGEHGPVRQAHGPRLGGVEQQRDVLPAAHRGDRRAPVGQVGRPDDLDVRGHGRVDLSGHSPVVHQEPGCAVGDDRADVARSDGHRHRARPQGTEHRDGEGGPARATDHDPVACHDPGAREPPRLGGHRGVELAPGQRRVGRRVDQRRMVGVAGGGRLDQVGQVRRAVRAVHGGGLLTRVHRWGDWSRRPPVSRQSCARRPAPATATRERTQSDRRSHTASR